MRSASRMSSTTCSTFPRKRVGGSGPFLWAGILAQRGILTDPTFYFAKNDPQYNGTAPTAIVTPGDRSALDPSFVTNRVLSFEFVGGLDQPLPLPD